MHINLIRNLHNLVQISGQFAEALIFLVLGVEIVRSIAEGWNTTFVVTAIIFCLAFRLILTYLILGIANRYRIRKHKARRRRRRGRRSRGRGRRRGRRRGRKRRRRRREGKKVRRRRYEKGEQRERKHCFLSLKGNKGSPACL